MKKYKNDINFTEWSIISGKPSFEVTDTDGDSIGILYWEEYTNEWRFESGDTISFNKQRLLNILDFMENEIPKEATHG